MAVDHYTLTVGTSAVKIAQAPTGTGISRVYVTNHDNATLYVGDASVSSSSGANWGFTILKDGNYDFELASGDALYAVSATSASVTVLILGA